MRCRCISCSPSVSAICTSMGLWLHTRDDGTCIACLAGSVLRYEFGFSDLPDAWNEAAFDRWSKALNCLRFGGVGGALGTLGRDPIPGYQLDRVVTQYRIDRDGFWRDMRRLWRDLKEAGL